MSDETKMKVAIGVILFVLAFFAWQSISMLPKRQIQGTLPLPPAQETAAPAAAEVTPPEASNPVVSIPTDEEIENSIEDQNQKRKSMEELIEARNEKSEKVLGAVKIASLLADPQETDSKKEKPGLSPEARDARNKELHDGINAHTYFPR